MELLLIFIATVFTLANGDGGCKELEYLECRKNKTFTGHVIKSLRVFAPGLEDCQHQCFLEDKCVSYNLGPANGMIRTCEVNDADHVSDPRHVVSKEDFEYCPIKNPCSTSPCLSTQFCEPNFYWNTVKCSDGRLTEWGQWSPCICTIAKKKRVRHCMSPMNTSLPSSACERSTLEELKLCGSAFSSAVVTGCSGPLGMQDGSIPNAQITASSYYKRYSRAFNGRLQNDNAWAAERERVGEYLQIDLGSIKWVTKIATQGKWNEWVTKYALSFMNSAGAWEEYKVDQECTKHVFIGNTDQDTVVTKTLPVPIKARYVKILPQAWITWITMRVDLYGCTSV